MCASSGGRGAKSRNFISSFVIVNVMKYEANEALAIPRAELSALRRLRRMFTAASEGKERGEGRNITLIPLVALLAL